MFPEFYNKTFFKAAQNNASEFVESVVKYGAESLDCSLNLGSKSGEVEVVAENFAAENKNITKALLIWIYNLWSFSCLRPDLFSK